MPPHSRAQRRRQQQRPRPRPQREASSAAETLAEDAELQAPDAAIGPTVPLVPPAGTTVVRPARQSRRSVQRAAPEPIDYTPDYQSARRDLIRIGIISGLLFVAMVALRFAGVF